MPRIDAAPIGQYLISFGKSAADCSLRKKHVERNAGSPDVSIRDSYSKMNHVGLPKWYKSFQTELAQKVRDSITDKTVVRKIYKAGSLGKAALETGAVLDATVDTIVASKAAGEAIAHTPELAERVKNAIRSGGSWHATLQVVGGTLLIIRIGAAGYSIQRAEPGQKMSTAATEAGSILGSAGGGFLGGAFGKYTGAGVGGLVAGGVGAVVGAAMGAIGFCLVGSFFGGKGGEVAGKELHASIDEFIHQPPVPEFKRIGAGKQ